MKDQSLQRTIEEIAALSTPCATPGEYHSRMMQINGIARQWLRLVNTATGRYPNRRAILEVKQ